MQQISTLFNLDTIPSKKKINSERAYVISQFVERLNVNAGNKYKVGEEWKVQKEVKANYVAFRLSHLRVIDLYGFLSQCKDSQCFEKTFWGSLKVPVDKPLYKKNIRV